MLIIDVIDINPIISRIYCSENNTHINNSWVVSSKDEMYKILQVCKNTIHPSQINNYAIYKRTIKSMVNEWCAHNILYKLHIFRNRTKDVDLNYPIKSYMKIIYDVIGFFYR